MPGKGPRKHTARKHDAAQVNVRPLSQSQTHEKSSQAVCNEVGFRLIVRSGVATHLLQDMVERTTTTPVAREIGNEEQHGQREPAGAGRVVYSEQNTRTNH